MSRTTARPNVADTGDNDVDDLGNVSGAVALDAGNRKNYKKLTITGNTTISFTNFPANAERRIVVELAMDAVGGYTITWDAAVDFGNAGAPGNPDPSTYDIYCMLSADGGTHVPAIIVGVGFAV